MKEKYCTGACKEIMLMIQSVIDGDATEEEKKTVEEHISHCESCRSTLEDLRLIRARTSEIAADPPCDLKDQILKRINEENRSMAIERVKKSKNRMRGITGTVAAAAVIALCVFGAGKYVAANGGLDRLTAMQGFMSKDMAEEEVYEIESVSEESLQDNAAPQMMFTAVANDAEEEGTTFYDQETILKDAKERIESCGVQGMYAEVFYANVEELPAKTETFIAGKENEYGLYETDDFASFVSQNGVIISGVQYEFPGAKEITSCGLIYGGENVLVILVRQ